MPDTLKREPSIHIKESDFKKVLERVLGNAPDMLVNRILTDSRKYAINSRSILVTNEKLARSSTKMLRSSTEDAMVMARLIYHTRKQMNHKGVMIAKAGTKDWSLIKDIAKNALDFCNDFGLDKQEGFKQYIKTATLKMAKFGLTKIVSMHSGICEDYEAYAELNKDKFPGNTEIAYKRYNYHIINKLGMLMVDYKTVPAKYICFMKVSEKCQELNISVKTYIDAQFEGLEWANGIPDPLQLVSDKGIERLQAYLYKNADQPEIKVKDETLINKMKNLKQKSNGRTKKA